MTASPKNLRVAAAPAIFGVHISRLSRAELVELMRGLPSAGRGAQLLATMNLDHVVRLQNDPAFRAAYEHAWHVTIDGTPVWLYSRLRGLRVERCTGADLIAELVPALRPESHRPFFVVSTEETGALLTQLLVRQGFKQSAIGHASPAFGFEDDAELSEQLCATIRKHKATHLVFGLGAPKSEIWIDRYRHRLGDLYACSVGSAPNFLVGTSRRAPKVLRNLGLEWAWRFAHDRRRLFRRYFIDSWKFIPAVARDLAHGDEELGAEARLDNR